MISSYGSLRSQLSTSVFSATAVPGGSFTQSGAINLRISGRNRAGLNKLSDPISVTYSAGQKIQITINSSAIASGEDTFFLVISGESTGSPQDAKKLIEWQSRESDQQTMRALPVVLELTTDAQLVGTESTYIADTTIEGGCDSLSAQIPPPAYPGDGSLGTPVILWLSNGFTEDTGAIAKTDTSLNLQVSVNGATENSLGQPYSAAFSSRIALSCLGLVRRSTGVLTAITGQTDIAWEPGAVTLPVEVPRGYAIAYSIRFRFKASELNRYKVPLGASIQILLYDEGVLGVRNPLSDFYGDLVLKAGDLLRIVPDLAGSIRRLSGTLTARGYVLPTVVGEELFTGLVANAAGQKIAISAAMGGDLVIRQASANLLDSEALRAVVSTESGTYTATGWTAPAGVSVNSGISVTINYPCNVQGRGTIRLDYPDVIAGNNKGVFNPPYLRVYVRTSGVIRLLPNLIPVVPGTSQTFLITDLAGATIVSSLPVAPSADFCLFSYGALTAVEALSAGTLTAGSYEIAIAYHFPSNEVNITKINHSATGCISEFTSTLAEASEIPRSWGKPVYLSGRTVDDAIRQIPAGERYDQKRWAVQGYPSVYYDAFATDAENLSGSWYTRVWLPQEKTSSDVGRFKGQSTVLGGNLGAIQDISTSGLLNRATDGSFSSVPAPSQGLLSARPAASASNRYQPYFATDANAGTLFYNFTGSAWTQVAYPNVSLPAQGLLSARPTASASNQYQFYLATDVNGGTLYCNFTGSAWTQVAYPNVSLPAQGLLSARPTASASNQYQPYFATDVNGGTLYYNFTGSTWTQVARGVSA